MTQIQNLFIKLVKTINITTMKDTSTVRDLKEAIKDKEGYEVDEIRLIYCGKQLADKKQLKDYAIVNESTLHLVLRLLGGVEQINTSKCNDRKIQVSTKRCSVFGSGDTCDSTDHKRVKFSTCTKDDCWVCIECLGTHYENLKQNGDRITCPFHKNECGSIKLDDVLVVLNYTNEQKKDEYKLWDDVYKQNNPEIIQCPTCTAFCFREKNMKDPQVRCIYKDCNGGLFCFWCQKSWKDTNNNNFCGNKDCKSPQTLNKLLNGGKTTISGISDVPVHRLCPVCKICIEYVDRCKHITCTACKHEFCHSCLIKWDVCKCERCEEGKGNGCNLGTNCTPADIQKLND